MNRIGQIFLTIFIVNFVTMLPMMALRSTLGKEKPDAIHTVSVHIRGGDDYYFRPALGIYYNRVAPGIFIAGMSMGLLAGLFTRMKR